jgi:hypothetical protein
MQQIKRTNTLKKPKPKRKPPVDVKRVKRVFPPGRRHFSAGSSDRD